MDSDLYEIMYNKAVKDNADVVGCGFIYENQKGFEVYEKELPNIDGKSLLRSWYKSTYHVCFIMQRLLYMRMIVIIIITVVI